MSDARAKGRRSLLRRIARLARRVRPEHFLADGVQGFVDLQLEIAALQRDIQTSIREAKKRSRADKATVEELAHLRQVRWLSRRLGDSLAWLTFLYNKKALFALARNARIPVTVTAEDDGSKGVELSLRSLANRGDCLPIMHDITDCLRIGDISMLTFGEGVDSPNFRTVEVKTTRIDAEPRDDGMQLVTLQVGLFGTEPFPQPRNPAPAVEASTAKPARDDRRLHKQLDRMSKAMERRDAANNAMVEVGGEKLVSLTTGIEDAPHWAQLRRAIRRARQDGYAYFSIDDFVGYSVHYSPSGVTEADVKQPSLVEHLKSSVLQGPTDGRDSLTVNQIPIKEDDVHAPFVLPFFLYAIPQRAVREMVEGKLLIVAVMNTARVERAIDGPDFTVKPGHKDPRAFRILTTLTWPEGSLNLEIPSPWTDMVTAMHEFHGIESVLSKIKVMRDIPNRIPLSDFLVQQEEFVEELVRESGDPGSLDADEHQSASS